MLNTKTKLSIALIVIGTISGAMAFYFGFFTQGFTANVLTITTLLFAVLAVIIGSITGFTQILDQYAIPITDDVIGYLEDDIESFEKKRFTSTFAMVFLTLICCITYLVLLAKFDKFSARWGEIPVFAVALAVILPITFVFTRIEWFRNLRLRTPFWVYLIPVIGLLLSTSFGISSTENLQRLGTLSDSLEGNEMDAIFIGMDFLEGFDCDDDACIIIFLVVLLVAITVILIIGSIYITHFWVLSGLIFLSLLIVITIHELAVVTDQKNELDSTS